MSHPSHWRSYRDVDATGRHSRLSDQLDDIAATPFIAAEKQRSLELLELEPDRSVLDVGCGNGAQLELLAQLVGPRGRVVGLDRSAALIAEARTRGLAERGPIELVVGDASSLPFEGAEFDACRADRTLQHLAEPEVGLAEMARVTRRRGRVVVTESRWGLVAPSLEREVTDRVLQFIATDRERREWVGYRLATMFERTGFIGVRSLNTDHTLTDEQDFFRFTHLEAAADRAAGAGAVTPADVNAWRGRLRDLVARGEAFAMVVILHVAGTKA